MFPQKSPISTTVDSETYPLGEADVLPAVGGAMALVALSHTPLEHRIYLSMLAESTVRDAGNHAFDTRKLMTLTKIRSSGTVRRGLEGLITKLSIERLANGKGNGIAKHYSVRHPEDILARRHAVGLEMYPRELGIRVSNEFFTRALRRVAANTNLSRREAQVALCCVEGLTNAEIGNRLEVSEQTIKFHLRHIFIKFGVRRRAELISRLLM
jgi:DNA-binding CsgD family transcriptional regulator